MSASSSPSAYRRFGSRVTVVEHGPQLLGREDPDVAEEIRRLLSGEGIEILLAADVLRVEGRSGEGVRLRVRMAGGEHALADSDILAATGRTPNTAGIGLDLAGVELDALGYVKVNDQLETTASEVWVIGECAGSPQFTHVSLDDFRVIRDNLAGGNRGTRDRLVPYCLFTDPPLARVGLSEREARQRGIALRVARLAIERRAADADHRRDGRLHEGARRGGGRPHPRLRDGRPRGRGGHGRGADRHSRRAALYGFPRRHSRAPDHGRGAQCPVRRHPGGTALSRRMTRPG